MFLIVELLKCGNFETSKLLNSETLKLSNVETLKNKTLKPNNFVDFQVRESPAPLNTPTPVPAPDHPFDSISNEILLVLKLSLDPH